MTGTNKPLVKVRLTNFSPRRAPAGADEDLAKSIKKSNGKHLNNALSGEHAKYSYNQCEIEPQDFIRLVSEPGWCFTYWMNGSKVNNEAFACSNQLVIDIDDGITIEEFLADLFTQAFCYGFYTSQSHTEEHHKFRALYRLDRDITDGDEFEAAVRGLFAVYNNKLDEKTGNRGRCWYGSVDAARAEYFGDYKVIDNATLDLLIAQGHIASKANAIAVKERAKERAKAATFTQDGFRGDLPKDIQIRDSNGNYFTPEDVFYDKKKRPCYCPFHNDKTPSAWVNYWEPTDTVWFNCSSPSCGEKRSMAPVATNMFVRSIEELIGDITQKSEAWEIQEDDEDIEFLDQPHLVPHHMLQTNAINLPKKEYKNSTLISLNKIKTKQHLIGFQKNPTILKFDERYLPDIDIQPKDKLIFIKSPKGTGKTEFLSRLTAKARKNYLSVLNLGHRIFLLEELSDRLGTEYYLNNKKVFHHFSLCVNSLTRLDPVRHGAYDYVIIDESEQFLINMISKTLEHNRIQIFNNLLWLLQNAKHVICCDADLTKNITIDLIFKLMKLTGKKDEFRVVLNEWKYDRELSLYESRNQMIAELCQDIYDGKRVFVTTSMSTDFIQYLDTIIGFIENDKGIEIPRLIVMADTNETPDVKSFIKNTKDESKKYQVVMSSPTLSTGVSIDGQVFDAVYGFFSNKVYTYQDCDQAISRVRKCNTVKVFIQPDSKTITKNEQQLRQEIIDGELKTTALGVYGKQGRVLNEAELIYVDFYARVHTFQQQCMVDKARKFTQLVQSNGYTVNFIEKDKQLCKTGGDYMKAAREFAKNTNMQKILAARNIDNDEASDLQNSKEALNAADKYALRKYKIAGFFRIAPNELTEKNIKSSEYNSIMSKYAGLSLLYIKTEMLTNRDDKERIYAKDLAPHYKHRARSKAMYEELIKVVGLDLDQILNNASLYKTLMEKDAHTQTLQKSSAQYKRARKEFNSGMKDIRIVVTQSQIDTFADFVNANKATINEMFNTNIKDPTQDATKVKVFNSLLGRCGITLTTSRKGKQGSGGKEYYINYSDFEMIAEKWEHEKQDIINTVVDAPTLPPPGP